MCALFPPPHLLVALLVMISPLLVSAIRCLRVNPIFLSYSDFGFQRIEVDQDCTADTNEDLDRDLIPKPCPEGQLYNRSRG